VIVGALSWFDESPTWLAATVASCAKVCDHLVAVDGAYAAYPRRPRGSSGTEQHEAITKTAEAAGLGLTLHVPREPWRGNEVAKRNHLMGLANLVAEPWRDWILVIDADEVVLEAPPKDVVLGMLAETTERAALVGFSQRHDHYRWMPTDDPEHFPTDPIIKDCDAPSISAGRTRRLFRADPSMRLEGTHYHYRVGPEDDPTDLWQVQGAAAAADLSALVIEHRHEFRDAQRRDAGEHYYRVRKELALETPPVPILPRKVREELNDRGELVAVRMPPGQ
jgi:hypothetical protein